MNIDKIKIKTFYGTYVPCRCGDCKLYYSSIEKLHPLICAYLRELGVNPLKPFELISISPDNQTLEFVSCQYVLFGTIEGDYKKEIDGILIEKDDHHPSLETNDDYFVISFGPVKISVNSNYRHLLKEEKVDCILHIIKKYDPIDMQNIVPKNEYYQEVVLIEKELSKRKHYFGFEKYIQQMFKEQFGKEVKHSICTKIFR